MTLNFKDIAYDNINTTDSTPVIKTIDSAKRRVVQINNIQANRSVYAGTSIFSTGELISDSVDRIAIFANEIIPEHFKQAPWINYTLTVNGKDYDIVPANSIRPGIKIIKNLKFDMESNYSINIKEEIKTAVLTISISTPNENETPFISNLKVMYGKKVSE